MRRSATGSSRRARASRSRSARCGTTRSNAWRRSPPASTNPTYTPRRGSRARRLRPLLERRATCCFDVIDGPDGNDASVRPNQIFAVSLPHSPLSPERQRAVVEKCARELLTSTGLRTLAPSDPRFVAHYGGSQHDRDAAYHQGTVWPWLLGPFALAHARVFGDRAAARSFLEPFAISSPTMAWARSVKSPTPPRLSRRAARSRRPGRSPRRYGLGGNSWLQERRWNDPFSFLGMHVERGAILVRASLPHADARSVRPAHGRATSDGARKGRSVRRALPARAQPFPYALAAESGDRREEFDDPYRFGPCSARSTRISSPKARICVSRRRSARTASRRRRDGVAFAVWAPNARRASVVGDFNDWDGRRHPMRKRVECGVWEIFVPGVAHGARYKFELESQAGSLLPLKVRSARPSRNCGRRRVDRLDAVVGRLDRRRVDARPRRAPTAATRRSRSTKCTSVRGGAARATAFSRIANSPNN